MYELGSYNKDFSFKVSLLDSNSDLIETIELNVPANIMNDWVEDSDITDFILTELGIQSNGTVGNQISIRKTYEGKEAAKISWAQCSPYQLGDKSLRNQLFHAFVYTEEDVLIEKKQVLVPYPILESWQSDSVITNYLISYLGFELEQKVLTDLVLGKLNEGTIKFAEGVDVQNGLQILHNYATFIALQIKSYKIGDIELDAIPTIELYDPTISVTIKDAENTISLMAFIRSLVPLSDSDKQNKLTNCLTNITNTV